MIEQDTNSKQTYRGTKKLSYCHRSYHANCIEDCQFNTTILKKDVTAHFSVAKAFRTDEPYSSKHKGSKYT